MNKSYNKYNTLPRRVIARLVDLFLLGSMYLGIDYFFSLNEYVFKYIIAISYVFYYTFNLKRTSQTLGMYVAGTKLTDINSEGKPTLPQVVLRELIGTYIVLFSILVLERYAQGQGDKLRLFLYTQTSWMILQFLTVVLSNKHRTLHDYIAQTVVRKVLPFGVERK